MVTKKWPEQGKVFVQSSYLSMLFYATGMLPYMYTLDLKRVQTIDSYLSVTSVGAYEL